MTEKLPYAQLTRGSLLVASPDINTGVYFRGVVLLCEHTPAGSFGVLVNKPLTADLPEDLLNLKETANPHIQLRVGGPLQQGQMMLLHSQPLKEGLEVCPGVFLGGDIQFLQEAASQSDGPHIRLCFGFCGWGPGQLEQEFLSGLWFLSPGSPAAVFDLHPEEVWRATLRQMGGKYATLSMIPDDLSLN